MGPSHTRIVLALALVAVSFALSAAWRANRPASADAGGFISEQIVGGLNSPTDLAFTPDGRIFITQKGGLVRVVEDGILLPTPFIQLNVNAHHERGLLGIALDPNFTTNGYVYLYYVYENNPADYSGPKTAQLVRVTAAGNVAQPGSEYVLLGSVVGDAANPSCSDFPIGSDCIPATNGSHNGGGLRFAPDGTLFLSIGDAETGYPSQDMDSFSGKLVRLNPDGTAPADNPFFTGDPNALRSKIYALGFRNPFRLTIQPGSGLPVVGDVGAGSWEEIDVSYGGENFGWPCFEATSLLYGEPRCDALHAAGTQTPPAYTYSHPPGAAIIAGVFYDGVNYPDEFQGALFLGDYVRNTIWSIKLDASGTFVPNSEVSVLDNLLLPVSFATGPEGNVYYLSLYGSVQRVRYVTGNRPPVAVASASPTVGVPPLAVQFTGDGSYDRDLEPVSYLWDFGDGVTSTEANPLHVFAVDGNYDVTLTVSDAASATGVDTVSIEVGNHPPVVSITAPLDGLIYTPGEDVAFVGSATDFEDGALTGGSLDWTIIIRHCEVTLGSCHFHPYWQAAGASGSFSTDDQHAAGIDILYHEITLTATDSLGATGSATVIISPDTDGDGLSDYMEYYAFGTDAFVADTDGNGIVDGAEDFDGDGCGNARELQRAPGSQIYGGLRDPFDPWDYFNPTQDGVNRSDDLLAEVRHYGRDSSDPLYSTLYDRTAGPVDAPWRLGPPDGMIRSADIFAAVLSYGQDCGPYG